VAGTSWTTSRASGPAWAAMDSSGRDTPRAVPSSVTGIGVAWLPSAWPVFLSTTWA
jgi:hypothetical protein